MLRVSACCNSRASSHARLILNVAPGAPGTPHAYVNTIKQDIAQEVPLVFKLVHLLILWEFRITYYSAATGITQS